MYYETLDEAFQAIVSSNEGDNYIICRSVGSAQGTYNALVYGELNATSETGRDAYDEEHNLPRNVAFSRNIGLHLNEMGNYKWKYGILFEKDIIEKTRSAHNPAGKLIKLDNGEAAVYAAKTYTHNKCLYVCGGTVEGDVCKLHTNWGSFVINLDNYIEVQDAIKKLAIDKISDDNFTIDCAKPGDKPEIFQYIEKPDASFIITKDGKKEFRYSLPFIKLKFADDYLKELFAYLIPEAEYRAIGGDSYDYSRDANPFTLKPKLDTIGKLANVEYPYKQETVTKYQGFKDAVVGVLLPDYLLSIYKDGSFKTSETIPVMIGRKQETIDVPCPLSKRPIKQKSFLSYQHDLYNQDLRDHSEPTDDTVGSAKEKLIRIREEDERVIEASYSRALLWYITENAIPVSGTSDTEVQNMLRRIYKTDVEIL